MSTTDLLLVGSARPVAWDFEAAEAQFNLPGVREDLVRLSLEDLFSLLTHQIMSPIRMAEFVVGGGRLNLDEFPYLEYQAPKAFYLNDQASLYLAYDERRRTMRNSDLALTSYLDGRDPTPRELQRVELYLRRAGGMYPGLGPSATAAWLEAVPGDEAARAAALRNGVTGLLAAAREAGQLYRARPDDPAALRSYVDLILDTYDRLHSVLWDANELAEILISHLPLAAERYRDQALYYLYRLAQVEYDRGDYQAAEGSLDLVLEALADPLRPGDRRVMPDNALTNLGRILLKTGRFTEARSRFQEAYLVNRENRVAMFYLIELDGELTSGRFFTISELLGEEEGDEGG
jgi:tetratricopeptide (TPR) repeat protein